MARRPLAAILAAGCLASVAVVAGVAESAPINASRPSIAGTAGIGLTLQATPGTWSGDEAAAFEYAWQRCEPNTYADCTDIPGGDGSSYLVRRADTGARLRVVVTASTTEAYGGSSTTVASSLSGIVPPPASTIGPDAIVGGPRNDRIAGGAGDDSLDGGGGADVLGGEEGNDSVNGGPGDDRVSGGSGNDTLNGGGGIDRIFGGAGRDTVSGNAGDDTIDTRDDAADLINCGAGRDVAIVDWLDVVRPGCETVRRTAPKPG